MTDDRQILQQAKDLISSKQYVEAQQLLLQIPENPTAQNWLNKLEGRIAKQQQAQQPPPADGGVPPQQAGGYPTQGSDMPPPQQGGYPQPTRSSGEAPPVPMASQVTEYVRPLFDRAPGMAITAGATAILFAIAWFITSALGFNGDSAFVAALVNTILLGGSGYLMMYLISIAVSDLNLMQVATFLGGYALINFIYCLIFFGAFESSNSSGDFPSVLMLLIFILAMAGLAGFAFSHYNPVGRRSPDEGLSLDSAIILGIATALIAAFPYMMLMFRLLGSLVGLFGGDAGDVESDMNLHMLFFGLFQGAFLSMLLYAMLKENSTGERPPTTYDSQS